MKTPQQRRLADIRQDRLRVLNAGNEPKTQKVDKAYPPPVETDYYKGLRLHFARGNRGGKSSSSRGGPASDATADAGNDGQGDSA